MSEHWDIFMHEGNYLLEGMSFVLITGFYHILHCKSRLLYSLWSFDHFSLIPQGIIQQSPPWYSAGQSIDNTSLDKFTRTCNLPDCTLMFQCIVLTLRIANNQIVNISMTKIQLCSLFQTISNFKFLANNCYYLTCICLRSH